MSSPTHERLYVARSIADAVAALAGEGAVPLAGATWIMRAPIRQEPFANSYVAIGRIGELRRIDVSHTELAIGACVTHAELVQALAGMADLRALAIASGSAANPAVRQVATIGGNLCATEFAASDLAPALLCLDADLEIETVDGSERVPIERFLATREALAPGTLLKRIVVARSSGSSTHVRLPLRKAGDYPVAIVSLFAQFAPDARVDAIRIAVGSVETVARRWPSLEAELVGRPLDPRHALDMAVAHADDFRGRDGIEAEGWYRVQVLPSLVRRAVEALRARP